MAPASVIITQLINQSVKQFVFFHSSDVILTVSDIAPAPVIITQLINLSIKQCIFP